MLGADGWLRSGDIAEIDADGFVKITDRKKDIIVTAGGKNIAPQNLENDLKASKFVSQALVVGDRRPYPAALITLDAPEIEKWAAGKGITGDMAALAADDQVIALVQGIVDDVNRERSRFEQIKRFSILPRDFTLEDDEVTPTLKLKRRNVMAPPIVSVIRSICAFETSGFLLSMEKRQTRRGSRPSYIFTGDSFAVIFIVVVASAGLEVDFEVHSRNRMTTIPTSRTQIPQKKTDSAQADFAQADSVRLIHSVEAGPPSAMQVVPA